ncbi:MAG: hypothetical protein GYB68_07395 [Chloroflexi bacterium]|nr:hypothetical protein [Chloroflexota bacterium]
MSGESCDFLDGCPMFKYFSKSAQAIYAYTYCKGDFTQCARYSRRMRGEEVPPCLLPQGFNLWDPEMEMPPTEFHLS